MKKHWPTTLTSMIFSGAATQVWLSYGFWYAVPIAALGVVAFVALLLLLDEPDGDGP